MLPILDNSRECSIRRIPRKEKRERRGGFWVKPLGYEVFSMKGSHYLSLARRMRLPDRLVVLHIE